MENNEEPLSGMESLLLIRRMIETAKSSISDNSHFFLLWGYATVIACVLDYILLEIVRTPYHYFAWFIIIVTLVPHFIFISRIKQRQTVRTFINEATTYVWVIIGLSYAALFFVFYRIGWQYSFPFYILLYSIGTFITGSLLKFKPMVAGGGICMVLVAIAPYLSYPSQILLSAFAIMISYIIPGHLLRSQYQQTHKPNGK